MNHVFWSFAIFGTFFFVLKTILSLFGLTSEDFDAGDAESATGTDQAFKVFSIHSLTGFTMMFGWVGLASVHQYGFSSSVSVMVAGIAGFFMMILTAVLFKGASLLVSLGTRFHVKELVGREAAVYHQIPENGMGKIQLSVNGIQREVQARSEEGQAISSFTEVKIIRTIDHQTVSVRPVYLKKRSS